MTSPISLPKGRWCLEKNCDAVGGHFCQAERDIRQFDQYPLTFYGIKMLILKALN